MSVEHRWSSRKALNLDVSLHYPPVGTISARTRNISLEGMFVELEGVSIPEKSSIEVTFKGGARQSHTEHRLPAYVVHQREDGVGLMLQHVGYREFDALRSLLNSIP
jgi:hypothetical protein